MKDEINQIMLRMAFSMPGPVLYTDVEYTDDGIEVIERGLVEFKETPKQINVTFIPGWVGGM